MSANPHANGGLLRKALRMPDFRDYADQGRQARDRRRPRTRGRSARFLRDIMRQNMQNFRVFGPDENSSNKLDAIYEVSKKLWLADYLPGGRRRRRTRRPTAASWRCSPSTRSKAWLEGYLLTGRHGFFSTYEAFAHVIDSMFNQHAKWLAICRELSVARAGLLAEPADHLDGLAAGPQRLHASGSRVPRRGGEQEPGRVPHLPAARRQLAALRRRPLPARAPTTST